MAFEGLSSRLQETVKKITGKGKVSEQDVKEMTREVRLALLEAEVTFKVVQVLIKKEKYGPVGKKERERITPVHQVLKIVQDKLRNLMVKDEIKIAKCTKL